MRRAALAIFGTVAALFGLLSFKTHATSPAATPAAASTTDPGTSSTSTGSSTGSSSTGSSSTSSSTSSSNSNSKRATTTSKTVTGDAADTQFGPVQVQITVRDGKVVKATAIEYPTTDPRDQEINAYAIPALQQETVGVSNANIDMISGATFTSEGYLQSLQSALDKAGL